MLLYPLGSSIEVEVLFGIVVLDMLLDIKKRVYKSMLDLEFLTCLENHSKNALYLYTSQNLAWQGMTLHWMLLPMHISFLCLQ